MSRMLLPGDAAGFESARCDGLFCGASSEWTAKETDVIVLGSRFARCHVGLMTALIVVLPSDGTHWTGIKASTVPLGRIAPAATPAERATEGIPMDADGAAEEASAFAEKIGDSPCGRTVRTGGWTLPSGPSK